jgi:SAM-dependent methyltransferase
MRKEEMETAKERLMGKQKVDFGNWMSVKMIVVAGILTLSCFGLAFLHWAFWIPAGLFLVIALYFAAARYMFSPMGGNIQDKVQELLLSNVDWDGSGKALDIGCGNGPLSVKLACKYPQAQVLGVDSWGGNWDYSLQVCRRNAELSGVADRVSFKQVEVSSLPFEDDSFDLVVSNLVFHEVREAADKRQPIREALRVLKPGGQLVLQDLFLLQPYFGTPDELMESLRGWGADQVEFMRTCDEPFIPGWLKLPFMLGTIAILRGVKR